MVSLSVSPNEQHFVLDIAGTLKIQTEDLIRKFLPLGFLAFWVELGVSGIRLVDQPKVGGNLPTSPQSVDIGVYAQMVLTREGIA